MPINSPLRILFAGTPDFAAVSLQALIHHAKANHYVLAGVFTQPDRPSGRGQKLTASPVKKLALEYNIPVYQPVNFKQAAARQPLIELNADIMIVAAYGLILPPEVLAAPRLGCINVHASLLPRWRGAAPIQRALIAGDNTTGITIMQMDVGLDTGAMLLKAVCSIAPTETAGELHDRLAILGASTLINALEQHKQGQLLPEPQQDHLACYAEKLRKQEGCIQWQSDAAALVRQIRGLSPWPVAYTDTEYGVMRVHNASITEKQAEISTEMNTGRYADNDKGENRDFSAASPYPAPGEIIPNKMVSDKAVSDKTVPGKTVSNKAVPGEIVAISKTALHIATGEGLLAITHLQLPGEKRLSVRDALNGKYRSKFYIGQVFGNTDHADEKQANAGKACKGKTDE